jgi:hypothetical protein
MIYLSSSCIKSSNVLDSIATLSGISKNIELSGGSNCQENLLESLKKLQEEGFNFLLHGYFPPPKDHFLLNFADPSLKTQEFIQKSAFYTKELGISYYSTHAGFARNFSIGKSENLEDGIDRFDIEGIQKNTNWFFENTNGLGLALENLFPNNGDKNCCYWMKPECIAEALDADTRVSLLLDLGHLKISANTFGFSWETTCEEILERFAHRIKEIHVSENGGIYDDHLSIGKDSRQIVILKKYADSIRKYGINVTLEARESSLPQLQDSYNLIFNMLEE